MTATTTTTTTTTPSRAGELALRDLRKSYGDVHAVRDVSLTIEAGEFVTLLGASGSGKTTTLNVVAGFVDPDAGEVSLGGRPLTHLPPHRREIGMVFQSYALFPHMTAAENVAFPLGVRGVSRADRRARVEEALATVRLAGKGDRYPRQLSGGQQQRVALARAIVFRPQLLLMDEPMGALDKNLREALQLEIMRVHRELGVTVVYVTHDQEEALVMSDRIAIYDDGRLRQVGSAEDLYERPASVFVAEFMGESNVFRGAIETDGTRRVLVADEWALTAPADGDAPPAGRGALVVRPERTRVSRRSAADGSPDPGRNALNGTLRDVIYLGSSRKYLIELGDGRVRQVRVGAGAEDGLRRGDDVVLSWRVDDAVLLGDEGEAA